MLPRLVLVMLLQVVRTGMGWSCAPALPQEPPSEGTSCLAQQAISGLRLMDDTSGSIFLRTHGQGKLTQAYGASTMQYLSVDGVELLEITRHPGSEASEFAAFRVRKAPLGSRRDTPRLGVASFATDRNITLGTELPTVLEALGPPNETDSDGDRTTLTYRYEDPRTCPVLASVNMPLYEGAYVFLRGRLLEMTSGFPYP